MSTHMPRHRLVDMKCQQIFDLFRHGMSTNVPRHRFVDMRCQQIFDCVAMGCQKICPGTDSLKWNVNISLICCHAMSTNMPGHRFVDMRCQQIFASVCHGMSKNMPRHRFVDMRCQQTFDLFAMGCQKYAQAQVCWHEMSRSLWFCPGCPGSGTSSGTWGSTCCLKSRRHVTSFNTWSDGGDGRLAWSGFTKHWILQNLIPPWCCSPWSHGLQNVFFSPPMVYETYIIPRTVGTVLATHFVTLRLLHT